MSGENEDFKVLLGKKVEELRVLQGFGVREFALIAGIEHHQLINIEKGRVDIRLSTIIKIAKGLKLEPKKILDF